jgi:hypothetical protein
MKDKAAKAAYNKAWYKKRKQDPEWAIARRAYYKVYNEVHKDRGYQQRNTERYRELRNTVILGYGGKCVCCGDSRFRYLQFDHVDGGGVSHRREVGNTWYLMKWIVANHFPGTIQLLCANCHHAKSWGGGCTIEEHPIKEKESPI